MKKRLLIFIIFITFLITLGTFFIVLNYLDPYKNTFIALGALSFSFILSLSSILSLFIYFFKKIYYRGEVYIFHILSSFRQAFMVSIFIFGLFLFFHLGALSIVTFFLLFILLFLIELFIQSMQNKNY
ncbi:hypothetical protein HGA92_05450 [Candidatus Gracilibacteria bacterium]|nr:hypothetical protein [Candidatus Gracilibacteria bacterium]NUJ99077.1 hypothetical protein [Candidatus Gracilibacteria bacterium]